MPAAAGPIALDQIEDVNHAEGHQKIAGVREMTVMLLMAAALVWLGVFPQPVLDLSLPVIERLGGVAP